LKYFKFNIIPLITEKIFRSVDTCSTIAPPKSKPGTALSPSKQALKGNDGKANRVFAQGTKVWEI